MVKSSMLLPTHRYAAGGLIALALNQAQIHQTRPLGISDEEERVSNCSSSSDSVSDDPQLWIHESSGLLRPIFRFLEIDSIAWLGLEETGWSFPAKHHIGANRDSVTVLKTKFAQTCFGLLANSLPGYNCYYNF
ncbi:transmembrane/coiled-coil protein [Thalictrum thalictroides]|uniref:Transmembrane/coiled-coil protein n=1 Tax=Thalictrum thalictroides TaxID=46969 RepID=A0A7J6UZ40_THATH|nr:transmembrane/coiled-coil protein [Thalictrum thalictroides]